MFFLRFIPFAFALLGLVTATKPELRRSWVIIHQLDILLNETQQLNAELDAWDRSMIGALSVSEQTEKLIHATRNATITISTESRNLHVAGALHVKRNTKQLMNRLKTTVDHIESLKEDFENVGLAQIVLGTLVAQQAASQKMNDAVIAKLPKIGRPIGRRLGRKISKIFQVTVDAYRKMLTETHQLASPTAGSGQTTTE